MDTEPNTQMLSKELPEKALSQAAGGVSAPEYAIAQFLVQLVKPIMPKSANQK